jgi:hypothetical protein
LRPDLQLSVERIDPAELPVPVAAPELFVPVAAAVPGPVSDRRAGDQPCLVSGHCLLVPVDTGCFHIEHIELSLPDKDCLQEIPAVVLWVQVPGLLGDLHTGNLLPSARQVYRHLPFKVSSYIALAMVSTG